MPHMIVFYVPLIKKTSCFLGKMLLAAGADVLGTNCDGFTALMLATFGAHYRIVEVRVVLGSCF